MKNLIRLVNYISNHAIELKNKYTDKHEVPIEFACIFCQNDKELEYLTNSIEKFGKIVEIMHSGLTYLFDVPIRTAAGPLRLVKIRKPDPKMSKRGDADFNTDYERFKKRYGSDPKFEVIKRPAFEMLRLSDPDFNVMACFSSIPKSHVLGIKF